MKDLETIILPVLEMSCAVCANNVENTVKGLPGVEEASVNFAANTLSVKYHPSLITPQKMREAVQEAGYDLVVVARVRAVETGYQKLESTYLRLLRQLNLLREDPS